MKLLISVITFLLSIDSIASQVTIAGEHIYISPKNIEKEGICIASQSIDDEYYLDIFVPKNNRGRDFYHVWIGGHNQYSVSVIPRETENGYAVQVSGTVKQLSAVEMTFTYTKKHHDISTYNISLEKFISKNQFNAGNNCKGKALGK